MITTRLGESGRSLWMHTMHTFGLQRISTTIDSSDHLSLTLQRENRELKDQLQQIRQWLLQEDRIEEQMIRYRALGEERDLRPSALQRQEQIAQILKMQMQSLPARVIYREPCFWSSFVWINVGDEQNKALKSNIIAKHSPVVIGNTLVGVIEEVQKKRSKVRLVSDFHLRPAVRVFRENEDLFLAKGELHGSSLPLWRARGQLLVGMGFNYDFADREGSSRNLRQQDPPLIQEGDLLVTSGLDGIFPPGLEVARVISVGLLREGETSYTLQAMSLVPNLDALDSLVVLPPLAEE